MKDFAVNEAKQQVQHMCLRRGRRTSVPIDGREHSLFVVLENERQDIDHLAVAAWFLEQVLLQRFEGYGKLGERCAIAKSAGLAL